MNAHVQPNECYVTGYVAKETDRVIDLEGFSFVVSSVRSVVNELGNEELAAFGLNADGSEHGPYFPREYAIQVY